MPEVLAYIDMCRYVIFFTDFYLKVKIFEGKKNEKVQRKGRGMANKNSRDIECACTGAS